jgi:hypothetical protein
MQLALIKTLIATLVLIWYYKDGRFFVTADSREAIYANGKITYDDNACKLVPIGRFLFFETGYPILKIDNQIIVSGDVIAKRLLNEHRGKSTITKPEVDSLADRWALEMKNGILRYLTNYPLAQRPPGGTNGVFVASLTDGSTYGVIRHLNVGTGNEISITPSNIAQGFVGVGDYDGNRIANRRLQDARSRNVLTDQPGELLYQVEENTITDLASQGVGGLVDEVVLMPNQAPLWLHRKMICP